MDNNRSDSSSFVLHISDFHINDDQSKVREALLALEELVRKLKSENIKIDYLLHTGDVIDSSDLHEKAASKLKCCGEWYHPENKGKKFDFDEFRKNAPRKVRIEFNRKLKRLTENRFKKAEDIMRKFISMLNVPFGNVVICCGNHDVLCPAWKNDDFVQCVKDCGTPQYLDKSNTIESCFIPFENFLDNLETANSRKRRKLDKFTLEKDTPAILFTLDRLNILILNTNWKNPKDMKGGYYCARCDQVRSAIEYISESETSEDQRFHIIMAHKPIYEICEAARLSYKRYIKTQFMADLQAFTGEHGIYLCGDKHTRSIVGSFFHDIPHYIGGEPLTSSNLPSGVYEVEYNLLEIVGSKIGMERKIHLKSENGKEWDCDLRPQDAVVSKLFQSCKDFFIENVFKMIASPKGLGTWENICQEIYAWAKDDRKEWYTNIDELYKAICKYRIHGTDDIIWGALKKNTNIFSYVCERLEVSIKECSKNKKSSNVLNIRGEYSSGKSTFLGLLYIFLLYEYSVGRISFIPAYFNLENNRVLEKIGSGVSYHDAAEQVFADFAKGIQKITQNQHQPTCYIIDGLDEQDCWSYSTEDSIGRGILNVLSRFENVYYVMAFSQHRLPRFKNTMPPRAFSDVSDIIYFNPIDVRDAQSTDRRFTTFINAFLKTEIPPKQFGATKEPVILKKEILEAEYRIVRRFRRLTINPGFMHHNYKYITAIAPNTSELKYKNSSVSETYRYYIDRQYERCLQELKYGFIHYAPAMAFLFSYRGYTYEQFKRLPEEHMRSTMPILKPIYENQDKIYDTFLFIKKQNDAREYLIALHYNRELRYYAEHPDSPIDNDSILNEYITRDIAVIIRKLWSSDINKLVIVCEKFLQRVQKEEVSSCVQSMLIYCLVHQDMYAPYRKPLLDKMVEQGNELLYHRSDHQNRLSQTASNDWAIPAESEDKKLERFLDLSLKHTIQVFQLSRSKDLIDLFLFDESFCRYNRQHQMLYYGDLSIRGEDKRNPLNPGIDTIHKGFDFHNCFNYLCVKLNSNDPYFLRKFDMYTIWDLIYSRLLVSSSQVYANGIDSSSSFFYRDIFRERARAVLQQVYNIFNDNIENSTIFTSKEARYFRVVRNLLNKILEFNKENSNKNKFSSIYQEYVKNVLGIYGKKKFWDRIFRIEIETSSPELDAEISRQIDEIMQENLGKPEDK